MRAAFTAAESGKELMSDVAFSCNHLSRSFSSRNGILPALQDVTFSVSKGEFVCVVGPSGCGKTTLLKILAGLMDPGSGRLLFQLPNGKRPSTALVFQEHGLFPWMTALDNVAFGLEMRGSGKADRRRRAKVFLERMGLLPFSQSYPYELSVGMRQRVGIARAFLVDPQILLMDEPFGALDAQTRMALQEELLRTWSEYRNTVVYVTHDIEEAILLSDRVLVMSGRPGTILEEIPIKLARPRDMLDTGRSEVKEIKWQIWKRLESDVRKSLSMTP